LPSPIAAFSGRDAAPKTAADIAGKCNSVPGISRFTAERKPPQVAIERYAAGHRSRSPGGHFLFEGARLARTQGGE